jgi:hypothetical protein
VGRALAGAFALVLRFAAERAGAAVFFFAFFFAAGVAKLSASGCARARATRSAKVFRPVSGRVAITFGAAARSEIETKSLIGS